MQLQYTQERITGILSVFNTVNEAVSNFGKQTPPEDIGIEEFEFWCPEAETRGIGYRYSNRKRLLCFSCFEY